MLENHEFCDHCLGCRPVVIDISTGQPFADDSAVMLEVNRLWNNRTSYAERKAFIDITVHNSRKSKDMRLAAPFLEQIAHVIKTIKHS